MTVPGPSGDRRGTNSWGSTAPIRVSLNLPYVTFIVADQEPSEDVSAYLSV